MKNSSNISRMDYGEAITKMESYTESDTSRMATERVNGTVTKKTERGQSPEIMAFDLIDTGPGGAFFAILYLNAHSHQFISDQVTGRPIFIGSSSLS